MLKSPVLALTMIISATAAIKIEKTQYRGWPNCYRIANGDVDLVVTTDVGPRIIRYGFIGGPNLFKEFEDQLGKAGDATWQPRGGHPLWVAPEDPALSYAPADPPIQIEVRGDQVWVDADLEKETRAQERILF